MFELKFKPIEAESNIQHFSTYKDLCLFIENGLKEGYVFAIPNRIQEEPEVLQVLLEEDEDKFNILLGTNFTILMSSTSLKDTMRKHISIKCVIFTNYIAYPIKI